MSFVRRSLWNLKSKIGAFYGRHPVVSNVCLYGLLYGGGDVTQRSVINKAEMDLAATTRIAAVGGGFYGPLYHYWYTWLDKALSTKVTARVITKKIMLDQLLCSPICLFVFFAATSILEKKEDIFEEGFQKGPKTYLIGCVYWPLAQAVNFAVLPTHLRTTYVGAAAFVWTTGLCYIKNLKEQPTAALPVAENIIV